MDDPNLTVLMPIARALGDLCESLVFVGGCATGLLATAQRAQAIRPTIDVDVVVPAVTIADYYAMERALAAFDCATARRVAVRSCAAKE
jgi:hypothetical protein